MSLFHILQSVSTFISCHTCATRSVLTMAAFLCIASLSRLDACATLLTKSPISCIYLGGCRQLYQSACQHRTPLFSARCMADASEAGRIAIPCTPNQLVPNTLQPLQCLCSLLQSFGTPGLGPLYSPSPNAVVLDFYIRPLSAIILKFLMSCEKSSLYQQVEWGISAPSPPSS